MGRSRGHGALLISRGKLTEAEVHEKLCAEIERERSSGVQYWALLRSPQWRFRRLRRASALGLYAQRGRFRSGVSSREAVLGERVSERKLPKARSNIRGKNCSCRNLYAGHHPDNRASETILKKLGLEPIENVFYEPTGLMHPSYICRSADVQDQTLPHRLRAEVLLMVATVSVRRKRSLWTTSNGEPTKRFSRRFSLIASSRPS